MMRTRVLVGLAAATLALAGCGGGDGGGDDISDLSANKILTKAKAAAKDAKSLSVEGEGQSADAKLAVDMEFTGNSGGGSISSNGAEIELLNVKGKTYFRAGPELYAQMGTNGEEIAKAIGDKWIVVDPSEASFEQFATFASRDGFVDELLSPEKTLKKTKGKKVEGVDCIGLKSSTGTLYVAKDGGRPISLQTAGSTGGLVFDYDDVETPDAPSANEVVDPKTLG